MLAGCWHKFHGGDEPPDSISARLGPGVLSRIDDRFKLYNAALGSGQAHSGLLLTDDRSMPRGRNTIGLFVRVLDEFLEAYPAENALRNQLRWLPLTSASSSRLSPRARRSGLL